MHCIEWNDIYHYFLRVPLVPVFSFGDHYLWEQSPNPKGSLVRKLQDSAQKIMDFALPLFHARGIFQYNYGLMPYRRSVHTVGKVSIYIIQSKRHIH